MNIVKISVLTKLIFTFNGMPFITLVCSKHNLLSLCKIGLPRRPKKPKFLKNIQYTLLLIERILSYIIKTTIIKIGTCSKNRLSRVESNNGETGANPGMYRTLHQVNAAPEANRKLAA